MEKSWKHSRKNHSLFESIEKFLRMAVVKQGWQELTESRDCMWKQLLEVLWAM